MNMEHFFELDHGGGHDLRGHRFKVKVQRSRLQLCQGFFSRDVKLGFFRHRSSSRDNRLLTNHRNQGNSSGRR